MARLAWDETGKHLYETGVDRGVLYPMKDEGGYGTGVAWNGLSKVSESPSGAEATAVWANNKKYLNLTSSEEFAATIEAYTSPKEFDECDGSKEIAAGVTIGQQDRKMFGFTYRTILGNDEQGNSYGYKIHIIYGAKAAPSEKEYATVNNDPEAVALSWEISTTPVEVTKVQNAKATATMVIDSTKTTPEKLKLIEDKLYGSSDPSGTPTLLTPDEVIDIINAG